MFCHTANTTVIISNI